MHDTKIKLCPTTIHQHFTEMVFTIDPATSTDLDDALSIKLFEDNTY